MGRRLEVVEPEVFALINLTVFLLRVQRVGLLGLVWELLCGKLLLEVYRVRSLLLLALIEGIVLVVLFLRVNLARLRVSLSFFSLERDRETWVIFSSLPYSCLTAALF